MAKQKTKYKTTFRYNLRWRKLAKMAMDAYGDEAFYGYGYVSVEARRSLIEPLEHAGFSVPRSWYGTGYINKQDRKYVYEKLKYIMTARKPKPEGVDDPLAQGMKIWEEMHSMIEDKVNGVDATTPMQAYVERLYAMNVLEALNQIVPRAGGTYDFMYALGLMNKKTEGEFWDATQEALAYKGYDLHESSMSAWVQLLLAVVEFAFEGREISDEEEDEIYDTLDKLANFNYEEASKNRNIMTNEEKAALKKEEEEKAKTPAMVQSDEVIKTADGKTKSVTKAVEDPEVEDDRVSDKPTDKKPAAFTDPSAQGAAALLTFSGNWDKKFKGDEAGVRVAAAHILEGMNPVQISNLYKKIPQSLKIQFRDFVNTHKYLTIPLK